MNKYNSPRATSRKTSRNSAHAERREESITLLTTQTDIAPLVTEPTKNDYFAARLFRARKRAGLTLRTLADKSGVSAQSITRWENGYIQDPQPAKLEAVAEALGLVPTSQIFQWLEDGSVREAEGIEIVSEFTLPTASIGDAHSLVARGDQFFEEFASLELGERFPIESNMLGLAWRQFKAAFEREFGSAGDPASF